MGNIQWQKNYGGSDVDKLKDIVETKDKGFILAGDTKSNDIDVTQNYS